MWQALRFLGLAFKFSHRMLSLASIEGHNPIGSASSHDSSQCALGHGYIDSGATIKQFFILY
jgi:hypothetical protein